MVSIKFWLFVNLQYAAKQFNCSMFVETNKTGVSPYPSTVQVMVNITGDYWLKY